jgi:cell division septum initiation protein DivIVA
MCAPNMVPDWSSFVVQFAIGAALTIGLFLIDWRARKRDEKRSEQFQTQTKNVLNRIEELSNKIHTLTMGIKESLESGEPVKFSQTVEEESKRVIIGAFREFVERWKRYKSMSEYDQSQNRQELQSIAISLADHIIGEASEYSDFLDPNFKREALTKAGFIRTFGEHQIITIGREPWDEMMKKGDLAAYQSEAFLGAFPAK